MVEIDRNKSGLRVENQNKTVRLEGCRLIKNLNHVDKRGFFRKIQPSTGESETIKFPILQVNVSTTTLAGTIRGLHYQIEPFSEAKLISCVNGSVMDVLLDMRPTSKTYGKFTCFSLTPDSGSLFVPPLVAHGFQSLEDGNASLPTFK